MRKKIYPLFFAGLGLFIGGIAAQTSQPQWLRYHTGREIRQILGNIGSQEIDLSTNRPAGVTLPEFKTNKPLFGKWLTPMVGSGRVWIVLDRIAICCGWVQSRYG